MRLQWIFGFIVLVGVLMTFPVQKAIIDILTPHAMQVAGSNLETLKATSPMRSGLHLVLCGTGSPMSLSRAGACTLILVDGVALMFDAGPGSSENIQRWQAQSLGPFDNLLALFLTHYHSDHIDGMHATVLGGWLNGKRDPLQIFGPPGVEQLVKAVNSFHEFDKQYRTTHHNRWGRIPLGPDGGVGVPNTVTFPAGDLSVEVPLPPGAPKGLRVTAFKVNHDPVTPAYGYAIEYKGAKIVLSGDTIADPNVQKFAQDATVLCHEVIDVETTDQISQVFRGLNSPVANRLGLLLNDTIDYHTAVDEVVNIAMEARVQSLVFTHIAVPDSRLLQRRMVIQADTAIRKKKTENPSLGAPKIVWGFDGLRIDIDTDDSAKTAFSEI